MSPRSSSREEEWTRPQDGHGDQRPAGGTSLRRPQDGRGISAPRGWPRGCVATDERRGGEGERRPTAAEISAPRERPRGDVTAEAAGRPLRLSPCADGPAKWAWVAYKLQLWPGVKYGIGTMTNGVEEAERLQDDHDYNLLNILCIARTVKKGWRKMHTRFGGFGFRNLATEQLIERLNLLLQHYNMGGVHDQV